MDNLQFKNWIISENSDMEKKNFLGILKGPFGLTGLDDAKVLNTRLGDIKSEKNLGRDVTRNVAWREIVKQLQQYRMIQQKNPQDPKLAAIEALNSDKSVADLVDAFVS